jgi:hypothetical protein
MYKFSFTFSSLNSSGWQYPNIEADKVAITDNEDKKGLFRFIWLSGKSRA